MNWRDEEGISFDTTHVIFARCGSAADDGDGAFDGGFDGADDGGLADGGDRVCILFLCLFWACCCCCALIRQLMQTYAELAPPLLEIKGIRFCDIIRLFKVLLIACTELPL